VSLPAEDDGRLLYKGRTAPKDTLKDTLTLWQASRGTPKDSLKAQEIYKEENI
jgi:hypothetical protein